MATRFLKAQNGGIYKDANGKLILVDLVTKLPLLVGVQSADSPYELTASDLDGVTALGDYAFYQKKGLRSIDLPETCISIGQYAFQSCSALTSVSMPSVTSIGTTAFSSCSKLVSVNMPNVTTVDNSVFQNCSALTSVSMPNVTRTNTYAFTRCTALTSVYMPNIEVIGVQTFYGCTSLTSLTIPSTCTSIGNYGLQCGSSTNKCTFTFEGTTPPTITSTTFTADYINKIIVPVGCGNAYKTAVYWNNFASYIEEATA